MTTVLPDMLDQIAEAAKAVSAIPASDTAPTAAVTQGMALSLASQIGRMDMTLSDATKIASAIEGTGVWSAAQVKALSEACYNRALSLQAGMVPAGGPPGSSPGPSIPHHGKLGTQLLEFPLEYISTEDWVNIEKYMADNSHEPDPNDVVTTRFSKLGVKWPNEKTTKGGVSVVLTATHPSGEFPDAGTSHAAVLQFKKSIKAKAQRNHEFQGLTTYPSKAANLPAAILDQAYTVDDRPAPKALPRYWSMLQHIAMRIPRIPS